MERREPYNAVLEAAMGYAGVCSVAAMDDVALVNKKVDTLDEGLGEQTLRIDRVNQDLMEWVMEFTDKRVRARESDRFLRREVMSLKVLCDSLVRTVGELRDDLARQTLLNAALSRRVPMVEPVDRAAEIPQQLVPYQGRLVPIEFPNRGAVMALDLMDEEEIPTSSEESGS